MKNYKESQRWRSMKRKASHTISFALRSADVLWSLFHTELVRQVGPGLPPKPLNNREYVNRIQP